MRQSRAIALLLLYLSVNTEMHQLLRLPVLFEHYSDNKKENKNITLVAFIVQHYFSEDVKDNDHQGDDQLPFKGACDEAFISVAVLAEYFSGSFSVTEHNAEKTSFYRSPFNFSSIQFAIWQPPRA